MESQSGQEEKRKDPRFLMDLPLEYREVDDPHGRGGMVVNGSEGGFLIESVKDMPIGARLNIAVLFPKWFELAEFKLIAEIVWKEPLWKEEWIGYQYGLRISQIIKEDFSKLTLLLRGQFNLGSFSFGSRKADPSEDKPTNS
jgi:hypothetical protein